MKPYLNGKELMSNLAAAPTRWIIDFESKSEQEAAQFSECYQILASRVRAERLRSKIPAHRQKWWLFGYRPNALYKRLDDFAWACCQTAKYLVWERFSSEVVFDQKLIAVALGSFRGFAVLQSSLHEKWALVYGSTLETRPVYAPTECLATFAFPLGVLETDAKPNTVLEDIGHQYYLHRRQVMLARHEGLTTTYNRFHDPSDKAADITRLRALHVEMDQAVAAAYGWTNLDLGHDFHKTKQGVRYTISESARRTVLDRLLTLNHQRYAEEVKAGLHDKGAKKGASKKKKADAVTPHGELIKPPQQELFG